MPLRKSPTRTIAFLAANRANARKSTGPRTARGKARVALNRLQHGRYANRLREKLLRTGESESARQYRWFRSEIARAFGWREGALKDRQERDLECLTAFVWAKAHRKPEAGSKPECPLFSEVNWAPCTSVPLRIRIANWHIRAGLIFWRQRGKYWTAKRLIRALWRGDPVGPPPAWCRESRWRCRVYRLRPPTWSERVREEARRRAEKHRT